MYLSGGYCIIGKMIVTGLSDRNGNKDRSLDLMTEASGLVGWLDVGLDEEVCIRDVSHIYNPDRYKLFWFNIKIAF